MIKINPEIAIVIVEIFDMNVPSIGITPVAIAVLIGNSEGPMMVAIMERITCIDRFTGFLTLIWFSFVLNT